MVKKSGVPLFLAEIHIYEQKPCILGSQDGMKSKNTFNKSCSEFDFTLGFIPKLRERKNINKYCLTPYSIIQLLWFFGYGCWRGLGWMDNKWFLNQNITNRHFIPRPPTPHTSPHKVTLSLSKTCTSIPLYKSLWIPNVRWQNWRISLSVNAVGDTGIGAWRSREQSGCL